MSKKNWLLSLSALAVVGVIACGDEEEPDNTPVDSGVPGAADTGVGGDAAVCTTTQLGSGRACTLDGGGAGVQLCTNGVPGGDCRSPLSFLPEAGFNLPDGALNGLLDGGFNLPDGALNGLLDGGLPDGALNNLPACPTGFSCGGSGIVGPLLESVVAASVPGASFCAATGDTIGTPPTCTGMGACNVMGLSGNCIDTGGLGAYCVQPCKK